MRDTPRGGRRVRYNLHGLDIEAPFALDSEEAEAAGPADLTVTLERLPALPTDAPDGELVAQLDRPGRGYVAVAQGEDLLVRVYDVADFRVAGGRVAIQATDDVAEDFLAT